MLTKTELLAVAHHEGSWGWDSSYGSRIVKLDCQLLDPSSSSSDTLLSAYTLIAQDSHRSLLARKPSVFQYRRNFLPAIMCPLSRQYLASLILVQPRELPTGPARTMQLLLLPVSFPPPPI
jgi:hypothetical protein